MKNTRAVGGTPVAEAATRARVLVADDRTILRAGLRSLLEAVRGGVVLIDLSLSEPLCIEAIREVKRRCPGTKALVLAPDVTPLGLRAALDAGADGYLLKGVSRAELMHAIEALLRGEMFVSPALSRLPLLPALDRLTLRERQVLKRIAEGARNRQIAQELALSTKTVEKHRSKLMRKLNLRNIAALTGFAIAHSLTALPSRSPR